MINNDKYGTVGTITETLEADNANRHCKSLIQVKRTEVQGAAEDEWPKTMAKTESSYRYDCKCQIEFVPKAVHNTNVYHGDCIEIKLKTKGSLTNAFLDS